MNEPITQSPAWAALQDDLNEKSFFEQGSGYHFLAILKSTPVGNYLYLPYGPVVKNQAAFDAALKSLKTLAKGNRALFIRLEPQNLAIKLPKNAKKSPDLNPKETWLLDLTPSLDDLYHDMKQSTRSRCKNYPKKGLEVTTSKDPADIRYLVALQKPLAKKKHIGTFSENYLQTELKQPFSTLYLVSYDPKKDETLENPETTTSETAKSDPAPETPERKRIVAASLFFDHAGTRYYMQSASDQTFYNNYPVVYALLIEAIKDAKAQGLKTFDFWGIAPDGAPKSHPWAGFTTFKKSFGGTEKVYQGTYDLVLRPCKYRLYRLFRALNRFLRRK